VINLFCDFASIRAFYLVYRSASGKANYQDIDTRTVFSRRLALSEPWEEGKSRRATTAHELAARQVMSICRLKGSGNPTLHKTIQLVNFGRPRFERSIAHTYNRT
jgi:hypothetical protein